jgi:glycosyltransferase involved in cell wall biosynthesis
MPLVFLSKNCPGRYDIIVSSAISKEHISDFKFDLIILQRQHKPEVLGPILEMKKKGAKLVYEIDDNLFQIPSWNPAANVLSKKSVQDGIKRFLENVDAVFVSTQNLMEVYRNYSPKVYYLPNSIDFELVHTFPPNKVLPVVCWQGSTTHEKDLEIAKSGFEKIAADPKMYFKLWCGYDPKTKKPAINVPGAITIPQVPFEAFYMMFSQIDADIGLAPLAANVFNKGKSNLKWLEYTAFGAVTVASNVGPYHDSIEDGVTGILVSDNRDWYDKVKMLIDDVDMRSRILQNALEVVREKYNIEKNYKYWETAIEEVLGRKDV